MNHTKLLLTFFFALNCIFTQAQTVVYKKIAQRHDDYTNMNWKGIDSIVYGYNADALQTSSMAIKGNASNAWDNNYKYTTTFTAAQKIQSQIRENWNGSNWANQTKYEYAYDANNDNVQIDYFIWNGVTWGATGKITYSGYTPYHKPSGEVVQSFTSNGWENISLKSMAYVSNSDKLLSKETYKWDIPTNDWKKVDRYYYNYNLDSISIITKSVPNWAEIWTNSDRYLFNYSTSPFLLQEYITQKWDTIPAVDLWVNISRNSYTYTTTQKVEQIVSADYAGANNWNPIKKEQYLYDLSDRVVEDFTQLNNGSWTNDVRKTYTYNGNTVAQELQETGSGSGWSLYRKTNFDYDSHDNMIFKQLEEYNGSYTPISRDFYYYNSFTVGLLSTELTTIQATIYPNPATTSCDINLNTDENSLVSIEIIDLQGRVNTLITQPLFKGQNKIELPIHSLNAGNYFVVITDIKQQKKAVKKLVIRN
ncbi:MAG: T9SS type A sorting domain-containing protein [Chitinophagaceae bacterium]|nr:T9SS type A sorting domain-containing protein [Chitinophagaceae bacterium]